MSLNGKLTLAFVIACLAAVVLAGIDWGLPSLASDSYLFASHERWTGAELAEFDPDRTSDTVGADVDRTPVIQSSDALGLNTTDDRRAEIIRRYRLYSSQPDEMITFMALQQMKPSQLDFDPRLYQYGGLWIYPVGALLKVAGALNLIDLRADKPFYYDHPEAFGRFYVVARLYTVAWYVVVLVAVSRIVLRLCGNELCAIGAAALAGLTPVVFAMAHEAKPHLPGTALMLLACLCALRWIKAGRNRDAILAGALCGLAAGMVLSAAIIAVILPCMIGFRAEAMKRRVAALAIAMGAMLLAYAITNPYVPINLIQNPDVLSSNFDNTRAMYAPGLITQALREGTLRLGEGATPMLLGIGVVAIGVLILQKRRPSPLAILIGVPSAVVLVQFLLLAAGKPSEYARFALFPITALAVSTGWAISRVPHNGLRIASITACILTMGFAWTWPYVNAFLDDAQGPGTRAQLAERLDQLKFAHDTLTVRAEPAPYALAPVDLWRWRVVLQPGNATTGDVIVRAIDTPHPNAPIPPGFRREIIDNHRRPAPITWANKPFEILIRE